MTDKFVSISDRRFHYLEWDNSPSKQKPVIVLAHGFNQSAHSGDEFCPRLADDYRLIAIDQRGHGESFQSSSGDYSRAAMANDILDIVTHLKLFSFILIGMSMGAANSIAFTAANSNFVKALVLVDWAPEVQKEGISTIGKVAAMEWNSFEEAVAAVHKMNPRRTLENIENRLKYTIHEKAPGRWTWRVDLRVWQQKQNTQKAEPPSVMWDIVGKVTCPTLLVRGEQSDILSDEVAQKMVLSMKDCTLVKVPQAGHSVAGDNPKEFFETVKKFLGSLSSWSKL